MIMNIDTFTKGCESEEYQSTDCDTSFNSFDTLLQPSIKQQTIVTDVDTKLLIRSVSISVCVNVHHSLYIIYL